jgi:hypothetical protein
MQRQVLLSSQNLGETKLRALLSKHPSVPQHSRISAVRYRWESPPKEVESGSPSRQLPQNRQDLVEQLDRCLCVRPRDNPPRHREAHRRQRLARTAGRSVKPGTSISRIRSTQLHRYLELSSSQRAESDPRGSCPSP